MKPADSLELPVPTPAGVFAARYSTRGLIALRFPPKRKSSAKPHPAAKVPPGVRRWHRLTAEALRRVLAGKSPASLPPLDLSAGTDFQQQVWRALRSIRPGRTRSYAEIARAIDKPKAARAVGGACGANPVPVLVPCHRVLAANRRLGGFSAGLEWKRLLLQGEGILPTPPDSLTRTQIG